MVYFRTSLTFELPTYSKKFWISYIIFYISDSQANKRTPVVSKEIKSECLQLPARSILVETPVNS